jgi:Mn2+/Fe2+ NRAMP family transporter
MNSFTAGFINPTMYKKNSSGFKRFFRNLGQGLITGASDDDPSGIATYSQAGAQYGNKFLWTAILTYPLIVTVQEMCARIGLVTDHGLAGVIKRYYPKYILYFIVALSFPSIVLNIGADIAAMGAVSNLLFPKIPGYLFSVFFTFLLMYAIIFWKYNRISLVLKWLCIALFSYILIPFLTETKWLEALKNTVLPVIEFNKNYFMMLVAILGTTISPYLFFWQTSMEVEEINQKHLLVDKVNILEMESGVASGLLLTNIVFYFIILTTGTVLYTHGVFNINTVEEAAQALRPLAGDHAYILFSIGVIGTGALAIPVLAGSLSYMIAETFDWNEGLDNTFPQAKGFYITMIFSLLVGLLVQFLGISPIKILIYTAVLYGLVAPFLIALIMHICNNKKIMGAYQNMFWSNFSGTAALIIMSLSALLLLYFTFN